ncbi:hypothetical protein COLO4_24383 [Corchorus olitorius]|uniref:Uncharacterized protein n=1 Tax=Corchorus olitorius TaxID=93759 RepID=A0A1R3IAI4_9ROSI|nr:hypothetical protein COLO4_24383 [Corchorus olitorius]
MDKLGLGKPINRPLPTETDSGRWKAKSMHGSQ